jgi:hypothetical protein
MVIGELAFGRMWPKYDRIDVRHRVEPASSIVLRDVLQRGEQRCSPNATERNVTDIAASIF